MKLSIRVHFDGKVIVPDEPTGMLPVNEPLTAELSPLQIRTSSSDEAQAAYDRLLARGVRGLEIPSEELRRERLYQDE